MRKLYFSNGSPFARKVRIVLLEKGLDFEADVNDAVRPIEEIQPLNPALQVPVLEDEGRRLFSSNLIISYLFERYPNPAASFDLPPLAPSVTRPECHWDDSLLLSVIESMADSLVNVRLMEGAAEDEVPFLGRQRFRIGSCLDWLEARVTEEGFWPGCFSVMDINLMCPLLYGEKRGVFDFRSGRWPKIAGMIDAVQARPSVANTPVNDWPPKS